MRRRRLLSPISLGPFLGMVDEPTAPTDIPLLRFSRTAMATEFALSFPYGIPEAQFAAPLALDRIDELEAQLTIYRDDSEVSLLNQRASREAVIVTPNLFDLLSESLRIWRLTDGAFDITTGALIKAWGFYRRAGRVPSSAERLDAMRCTGSAHLLLDRSAQSVRFLRPGLEINLGAIGKGYALDVVGESLRRDYGLGYALLHGGGSSILGMGTPPGLSGWGVRLRHPWQVDNALGTVRLHNRAMGTSAATYQYFEYNKRKLGHLLDPRTGWPASGMLQATVVAPSAAVADALSTAFFVGGVECARRICHTHPEIGAILLPESAEEPVVLNLSSSEFTPSPVKRLPEL